MKSSAVWYGSSLGRLCRAVTPSGGDCKTLSRTAGADYLDGTVAMQFGSLNCSGNVDRHTPTRRVHAGVGAMTPERVSIFHLRGSQHLESFIEL